MMPEIIFLGIPLLTILITLAIAIGRRFVKPKRQRIGFTVEHTPGGFIIVKPIYDDENP